MDTLTTEQKKIYIDDYNNRLDKLFEKESSDLVTQARREGHGIVYKDTLKGSSKYVIITIKDYENAKGDKSAASKVLIKHGYTEDEIQDLKLPCLIQGFPDRMKTTSFDVNVEVSRALHLITRKGEILFEGDGDGSTTQKATQTISLPKHTKLYIMKKYSTNTGGKRSRKTKKKSRKKRSSVRRRKSKRRYRR